MLQVADLIWQQLPDRQHDLYAIRYILIRDRQTNAGWSELSHQVEQTLKHRWAFLSQEHQ